MFSSRSTKKIVKDGRVLHGIARKNSTLFFYDRRFKYLTHSCLDSVIRALVKPLGYEVEYFDGCFHPFLVRDEQFIGAYMSYRKDKG